jgi:hypothetical protein
MEPFTIGMTISYDEISGEVKLPKSALGCGQIAPGADSMDS